MSMPEDNKGTAPEDVEAHVGRPKRDAQGEEPGSPYDTPADVEDVEAHVGRPKRDVQGDEVPRLR